MSAAGLAADFALWRWRRICGLAIGQLIGGLTSASFTRSMPISPTLPRRSIALGRSAWSARRGAAAGLGGAAFPYGLLILGESLKPSLRMPFSWRRAYPVGALELLGSHRELSGLAVVYFRGLPRRFFDWLYGLSIGEDPVIPFTGDAFLLAGLVLGGAALVGLKAGRRGPEDGSAAVPRHAPGEGGAWRNVSDRGQPRRRSRSRRSTRRFCRICCS